MQIYLDLLIGGLKLLKTKDSFFPWINISALAFGLIMSTIIYGTIDEKEKAQKNISIDETVPNVVSVCLNKSFSECVSFTKPTTSRITLFMNPTSLESTYIISATPTTKIGE